MDKAARRCRFGALKSDIAFIMMGIRLGWQRRTRVNRFWMEDTIADQATDRAAENREGGLQQTPRHRWAWLAGFQRQAVTLAAAVVTACLLAGCQNVTGSTEFSQIRIIAVSPNAPGLDIYEDNSVIAYNLGFGTVTSYVPITPGSHAITAETASTTQKLVTASGNCGYNKQYTVLISNVLAQITSQILTDQSSAAPTGEIALRFIDEATQIGGVDVYLIPTGATLAKTNPQLTNLQFPTVGGYINIPSGSYNITLCATGTTTVLYTGATYTYAAGAARTLVLIDQQILSTPSVNVLTADDYDSPSSF